MNRLCDAATALASVQDGMTVGIGGMTLYRRPFGLVRELLRRKTRDLTLLGLTLGLESDVLVGAGRVRRVRTCYFGLESFGLAPMFTLQAGAGGIEVVEETEATLAAGLRASLATIGFLPIRGILGSEIPRVRPDLKTVRCPYTGEELLAVPALKPDAVLLHAQKADARGNAVLTGNLALDREMATLADVTIVSAEEIVPTEDLPEGECAVAGIDVTHVVHLPGGAAPGSCYPVHGVRAMAFLNYMRMLFERRFDDYLEGVLAGTEWVTESGAGNGQPEPAPARKEHE